MPYCDHLEGISLFNLVMKLNYFLRYFLAVLGLGLSFCSEVHAVKPCVNCGDAVIDEEVLEHHALECPDGHRLDYECLAEQVRCFDIQALRDEGIPCCGTTDLGDACIHNLSLSDILQTLEPADRDVVTNRLELADRPGEESREIARLNHGILEAFNLRCPTEGCGQVLERPSDGGTCNSTQCMACGAVGCYLCLDQFRNMDEAHDHVREHSNDCWEFRPGFTARYHWLLARAELAQVFKIRVVPEVRETALKLHETELKSRKMWPMPAGLRTEEWLGEVNRGGLSLSDQIELLQNELIYRQKLGHVRSAELLTGKLREVGGVPLESLDVRDAGGPKPEEMVPERAGAWEMLHGVGRLMVRGPRVTRGSCSALAGLVAALVVGFQSSEIAHMKAHWTPNFAQVTQGGAKVNYLKTQLSDSGHLYLVGGRLWSGVTSQPMNYSEAQAVCAGLEGGLPTEGDYSTLRRALGFSPSHQFGVKTQYDPSLVTGLRFNLLWAENPAFFGGLAQVFDGGSGYFISDTRDAKHSVRCIFQL